MPRDSTETKERLVRAAERLFARHGLYQVTVREITQAAGQRNVSALNYHFGSREGIIDTILVRSGDPIEAMRCEHRSGLPVEPTTRQLLAALVVPYASALATTEGRDYLRIVAQMSNTFPQWRGHRPGVGPCLQQILGEIEERPTDLPLAIRQARVVGMIQLMTAAMSERARSIESGEPLGLDEPAFVANLTDMLVGVIEAPLHGPVELAHK